MIYMSIQAFKKKGVINYGSRRSAKTPGGIWLSQGPFGKTNESSLTAPGIVGFSLNGGTRNVGYTVKVVHSPSKELPFMVNFPKEAAVVVAHTLAPNLL